MQDPLSRVSIVLDHPKNVVNIAGVVRVMMNYGLSDLRLVAPDEYDEYRIEGIAHRSGELLERTRMFDTLEEALADSTYVVGTTARARTAGRTYTTPREVATAVGARAQDGPVSIVFGREDRGLTNEALDLCHAVAIIPTDPDFSSLNLAQASLVLAYEVFMAIDGGEIDFPKGRRATRPPTQEELESTYAALEEGLHTIEFYKAREPAAVMRTLRTLISRAAPDLREARLIRAIGYEMRYFVERIRQP